MILHKLIYVRARRRVLTLAITQWSKLANSVISDNLLSFEGGCPCDAQPTLILYLPLCDRLLPIRPNELRTVYLIELLSHDKKIGQIYI